MGPATLILANPEEEDTIMAKLEAGPAGRINTAARVANPANMLPESLMGWVHALVPTLTGTALGTIEGLAATGRFPKWANLSNGWKALILGAIAGAARYAEEQADDAEVAATMHDLYCVAWAFAVAYGVQGLIITYLPMAGLDGLGSTEADHLNRILDDDAEGAEAAVKQLVDQRDQLDAGVGELDLMGGGFDLGELNIEEPAY